MRKKVIAGGTGKRVLKAAIVPVWVLLTTAVWASEDSVPFHLQLAVNESSAVHANADLAVSENGLAVNRGHDLSLQFSERGLRLEGSGTGFGLYLERFGRGRGDPVQPVSPQVDGARVRYERDEYLTEWFLNLPRGLEHGWTIRDRVPGEGPLALELDTLRAPDRAQPDHLVWGGLTYSGLYAADATGRRLPTSMTHDGTRLRIEVDDAGAVYPVVVDPWVQAARLVAQEGAAGDLFARAVALDGDLALVGADLTDVNGVSNSGAAYIFRRSGASWTEEARLVRPDGAANEAFGFSVALSGETALVSANAESIDGNNFQGTVYVYVHNGEDWVQEAQLVASDGTEFNQFGWSIALDGDTALIGALNATIDGEVAQGAAYVFTREGDQWSEQAKLVAPDGVTFDQFGMSVSLSGNTALIGAWRADVDDNENLGAAYVFTLGGGSWSLQQKLTPADPAGIQAFGRAVSVSGDTAAVGVGGAEIDGTPNQGAAYVFTRDLRNWTEQARLTASDGAANDFFGVAVAASESTILVGAPLADIGPNANQGAVYVFSGAGSGWNEQEKLLAEDGSGNDNFGTSIALADGEALIGANLVEVDGNAQQGVAYLFTELPDTFGTLEGTVLGLSACDGSATPLVGVDVIVEGSQETHTLSTNESGFYRVFLDETDGPFDITVAPPEHVTGQAESVVVSGGEVVVEDFDLLRIAPCATVDPDGFVLALESGAIQEEDISIDNSGIADLEWMILEGVIETTVGAGAVRRPIREASPVHTVAPPATVHGLETSGVVGLPLDYRPSGNPGGGVLDAVTLSHSESLDIQDDNTIACVSDQGGTTPNSFFRTFTLEDFGISGEFNIEEVMFGVEVLSVPVPIDVNLYLLEGEFLLENLVLLASETVSLQAQQLNQVMVPITATVPPDSTLVFEVRAPNMSRQGVFFPGSNAFGESAPSYLAAAACEFDEPVTYASIGFPNVHLVMAVTGTVPVACGADWMNVEPASGDIPPDAGQQVTLGIDASGLEPGPYESNVCIESNDPEHPLFVLPVELEVLPPVPRISVSPSSIGFGTVVIGDSAAAEGVVIESVGTAPLEVALVSDPAAPFSVADETCGPVPFVLVPGDSCQIDFAFAPQGTGSFSSIVTVNSDAESGPVGIALSGTGELPPEPGIGVSPLAVEFGEVEVGDTSPSQAVTVDSTGDAQLQVDAISAPGDSFVLTGGSCTTPPFGLAPGASCTLEYAFSPQAADELGTTVTIASNAEPPSVEVTLSGTGVQAQAILDLQLLDFGTVELGVGETGTVGLSNQGTTDLVVEEVTDPGPPFALEFSRGVGTCPPPPFLLPLGESCGIGVIFQPGSVGLFTADFEIVSNAPSSPDVVGLRGEVVAVRIPALGSPGLVVLILLMLGVGGWMMMVRRHAAG